MAEKKVIGLHIYCVQYSHGYFIGNCTFVYIPIIFVYLMINY